MPPATFVLIHGGVHGAWCWERLVPELEALGHRAVAPDCPADRVGASADDWASAVLDAWPDGRDVVVVGHSMGGLVVPLVAAARDVRRMVFLGAVLPVPGRSPGEVYAAEGAVTLPPDLTPPDELGRTVIPYEVLRDYFYNDCDEDVVRWAYERIRPQDRTIFALPCSLEEWPDVPGSYIVMADDRCVSGEYSRRVARERLGGEAIELPGSHSPFVSRPAELARVLDELGRA